MLASPAVMFERKRGSVMGASSDGYTVRSGMSGQAKELDGAGDDADHIHKAIVTDQCYGQDALGGAESAEAFNAFAAAWLEVGKPVPIAVGGTDATGTYYGHALMVVGQQGDKLEIYNPYGTTTWVSEDDFVNGGMAKAANSWTPNTVEVHLPQD
ncbi:hypothetical protein [Streptomyces sp. NPDC054783]